ACPAASTRPSSRHCWCGRSASRSLASSWTTACSAKARWTPPRRRSRARSRPTCTSSTPARGSCPPCPASATRRESGARSGPITEERLRVVRQADAILLDELKQSGWYRKTSQAFAVLLPIQSVGVMGDGRTYEDVIALRSVQTDDFMTADWSHLPYDVLAKVSTRIINQVAGVNRVVYDVSSKPPATIEWE